MNIPEAINYLKRVDPQMERLIQEFGPPDFTPEQNYFEALVRAIIFQQLSGKAAGTILKRFLNLFEVKRFPSPKEVLSIDLTNLRSAGLSGQKIRYLRDLSEKWEQIQSKLENSESMTDEEIRSALLKVKGIGPWTVDMFLMFTLNRPDVFPALDLGIRKGFRQLQGDTHLPSPETVGQAAEKWRPYRTVAAWYLWKVVDGPFAW